MMVSIPEDKRAALLTTLVDEWGPKANRQYFTLAEAAELLGVLVSLCRICPFLFVVYGYIHWFSLCTQFRDSTCQFCESTLPFILPHHTYCAGILAVCSFPAVYKSPDRRRACALSANIYALALPLLLIFSILE